MFRATVHLSPLDSALERASSPAPPPHSCEPLNRLLLPHLCPGIPLLPSDLGVRNSHGCFWISISLASPHPVTLGAMLLFRKSSVWPWLSAWALTFSCFHGDILLNFQSSQTDYSSELQAAYLRGVSFASYVQIT